MADQAATVTMNGNPLPLCGPAPAVGQKAPDFEVLGNDLSPVTLKDLTGQVLVLASVPSLDTDVCSLEAKHFNDEAAKLTNTKLATISMDLPFAQKRWADENEVSSILTLSDHRAASFGKAYGVLIEPLRLLARTVFVLDKAGVVQLVHIVPEITDEPDYELVLNKVRELA
ncbi:MAG: thioredoxin-dependent peroxiredoxin [Desulfovibrionales bacterium]|nr:thioredoxin-dependent peroxiredoxin [Desulfovibrionales bacterium]